VAGALVVTSTASMTTRSHAS